MAAKRKKVRRKHARNVVPLESPGTINSHVGPITDVVRQTMIAKATEYMEEIMMNIVGIKPDHNSKDTPSRWAKMFVNDILKSRWAEPPELTEFHNPLNYDQILVPGSITFNSFCGHHLLPFYGDVYIGVLPGERGITGLSKYARIVDYFAGVGQIQEDLTAQIALFIERQLEPRGVAVRMVAHHACTGCRGVLRPNMLFTTQYLCGEMIGDQTLREEFNMLVQDQIQRSK